MKKIKLSCILCVLFATSIYAQQKHPYQDPQRGVEERVDDLLSRMTLDEKVYQLNQYILGINTNINNIGESIEVIPPEIGSVIYFTENSQLRNIFQKKAVEESRLGIPILFGFDIIHGYRTIFPMPLAQSCSWNTELVKQASAVAAQESRMSGVDWTFSPMIDITRDGRWGRIVEGYGEDSYTNSVFCVAAVQGYQGNDLRNQKSVASCLKHYVGYGVSEGGRDYEFTDISRQSLWDTFLMPYKAGVDAGAATIMSSFNDISGTPATANHYTLTEILRNQWGFEGFVVSDWNAVEQLIPQGVASNKKEAALKAFIAGTDMDMKDNCYQEHLAELVAEGKVSMQHIDQSVGRILKLKFELGLFENPYTPEYNDSERILLDESRKIAKQLAQESIVLLKNENNILPLTDVSRIALIGPLAKDKENLLGSWRAHGNPEDVESIFEGLATEFGKNISIDYTKGCDFDGDDRSGFEDALSVAKKSDVIILCLGEKREWSGENASRSTISLPNIQEELIEALSKTGKPIVVLLSSGRPIALNKIEPLSQGIMAIWQPGIAGGKALAELLSGRANPSGKLSVTFPLTTGQIPIYYNHRQSSRPNEGKYQDIPSLPLYEFGYGLSYTTFAYGEMIFPRNKIEKGEKVLLKIPVTNTGKLDGYETVHWFISDPFCSISRPIKELKYFEKKFIKAGETILFEFELDVDRDLSFVDSNGNRFVEAGDFYVLVKDQNMHLQMVD